MGIKLCLCCKKGYVEAGVGTFDICPICGWEDDDIQADDPDYPGGANELSLNEYRKQYEQKLKENPDYIWEDKVIELNFSTNKPAEFKKTASKDDKKKYSKIKF